MTGNLAHKASEPSNAEQRSATASYIATMSSELAELARRHGLDALGYLLDMTRIEADSHTRAAKNIRQAS
jgi:hypothetical protein